MRAGPENAFRFASETIQDPIGAVSRWKMLSGRKAAGCLPIYVPEEILHAGGMLPVTVWGTEFGRASPGGAPFFVCSVAGGILSAIRNGKWRDIDAWVFPSTCDTVQNAFEVLFHPEDERIRFPFVFPLSPSTPGATEYLLDRMEAFREWTGQVSGREVSEGALERSIRTYNENRRVFALLEERMAESPGYLSAAEFVTFARAGMMLPKETHTEILKAALSRSNAPPGKARTKVFLTGMMATDPVAGAIDAAGAAIVGNDLALGHRYYSGSASESGDMTVSLVRRHQQRDPCSTLHGAGKDRFDLLFRRLDDARADRLLLLRMRQCEPESGDIPEMAAASRERGIPFLCLDVDLYAEEQASVKMRVQAFAEMGE